MHFCCNTLVDIAVFGQAEVCADKIQKENNSTKQCTTIQEKDCCDSKTIVKEAEDTFKKESTVVEVETFVFLNTFFYSYINLFEGLEENVISFRAYRPPFLSTDIIILNETFLI